ncbi:MAG: DNA cytosine methyltransferase [Synechococcales bacterium]|nr:DNA cytosine methyltransferase [Synechococcales bacterium]
MGDRIVSLFSGCGGLDLGFAMAGFKVIWANEFDKAIGDTYRANHLHTQFDPRDIRHIPSHEIPDCDGIIGGPPCQSWSEAGMQRGLGDERGQLFLEYVRILQDKQPLFFVAENVSGMLHKKHQSALDNILKAFEKAGYWVSHRLLNAKHYGVPQERKRVIFIGLHQQRCPQGLALLHHPLPQPLPELVTLRQAIWDLRATALPAIGRSKTNGDRCLVANHEYMQGDFSSLYLSRNRVRSWDEVSFTIQAGGRHAPLHPQANRMIYVDRDRFQFDPASPHPYRRLSVRECARIQTFPDHFTFHYQDLAAAYKMIGNAVPVKLAYQIAHHLKCCNLNITSNTKSTHHCNTSQSPR